MSQPIITVDSISKAYRIGTRDIENDSLGSTLLNWLKSPARNFQKLRKLSRFDLNKVEKDVLWALREVSFEVQHGEVLGIVGKNGAGKSTLLKVLSQVTPPTLGEIRLRGRVASLLEVGTGFNPELTGRENVFLNGTILGMTKAEVQAKYDEIVEFSGVSKFIDTPVKRYSSGMKVRLAFAVAAHLDPEILVIDEVLAVGDAEFQAKCLGKMQDVAGAGRTVLFVSHNMNAVNRLCTRAILMKNGQNVLEGDTKYVVSQYVQGHTEAQGFTTDFVPTESQADKDIELLRAFLEDGEGGVSNGTVEVSQDLVINLRFRVREPIHQALFGFTIKNGYDEDILLSYSEDDPTTLHRSYQPGEYSVRLKVPQPLLKPDYYHVALGLINKTNQNSNIFHSAIDFEVVNLSRQVPKRTGFVYMPLRWDIQLVSMPHAE